MFENGRGGQDREVRGAPAGAASVQPPQDVTSLLRAHGGDGALTSSAQAAGSWPRCGAGRRRSTSGTSPRRSAVVAT